MGKIVLDRFNGQEIYYFEKGTITAMLEDKSYRLWFSASSEGAALKTLPDTEELQAEPSAELTATVEKLSLLEHYEIIIEDSYDHTLEDYVTSFYYCEHQDLNNNQLNIKKLRDSTYKILWTGTTIDVNYYDGSKPDTRVIIEGEFVLELVKEIEK